MADLSDPVYLGLIEDVLDNPGDDAPRLVLADWLDDHGDGWAEFVRAQVGLSLSPPCDHDREAVDTTRCRRCQWLGAESWHLINSYHSPPATEEEAGWPFGKQADHLPWRSGPGQEPSIPHPREASSPLYKPRCAWHRGFISAVMCDLDEYLAAAAVLFACHPVTSVTLSDRIPGEVVWFDPSWYGWASPGFGGAQPEAELPLPVWDAVEGEAIEGMWAGSVWKVRPTREGALSDLSRALVAHGRELARPLREARRRA